MTSYNDLKQAINAFNSHASLNDKTIIVSWKVSVNGNVVSQSDKFIVKYIKFSYKSIFIDGVDDCICFDIRNSTISSFDISNDEAQLKINIDISTFCRCYEITLSSY